MLLPIDRWFALLNLLLAVPWLAHLGTHPWAAWLASTHVIAVGLPALLSLLPDRTSRITRIVREGYPVAWLALVWGELGLRTASAAQGGDAVVAAWDAALFGRHLNLEWMPAMAWPWFSETMHAVYDSYYLLLALVPLLVLASRCPVAIREAVLRLVVTYALCFVVYAIFPVRGPLWTMPAYPDVHRGFFWLLSGGIRAVGDAAGTAFPSSHTAGAVVLAWIAWPHAGRPLRVVLAALATGVALATVYTQNHFAVDTLAGLGVAVLAQTVVVPWLVAGGCRLPTLRPPRLPDTGVAGRLFGAEPGS